MKMLERHHHCGTRRCWSHVPVPLHVGHHFDRFRFEQRCAR